MNKRVGVWIGVLSLTLGAACAPADGLDESADDDHAETLAAIQAPFEACGVWSTPHAELKFANGTSRNYELRSRNGQLSKWWDRTDCRGFVADFVRDGIQAEPKEEAWVDGIHDSSIANAEACATLVESRRVYVHGAAARPEKLFLVSDTSRKSTWRTGRCISDTDTLVWFGNSGGNYHAWFSNQDRVRVVTQAFVFAFPVDVKAYLQSDNLPAPRACTNACCYTRFEEKSPGCFI
jgi:hypothetical protein